MSGISASDFWHFYNCFSSQVLHSPPPINFPSLLKQAQSLPQAPAYACIGLTQMTPQTDHLGFSSQSRTTAPVVCFLVRACATIWHVATVPSSQITSPLHDVMSHAQVLRKHWRASRDKMNLEKRLRVWSEQEQKRPEAKSSYIDTCQVAGHFTSPETKTNKCFKSVNKGTLSADSEIR